MRTKRKQNGRSKVLLNTVPTYEVSHYEAFYNTQYSKETYWKTEECSGRCKECFDYKHVETCPNLVALVRESNEYGYTGKAIVHCRKIKA